MRSTKTHFKNLVIGFGKGGKTLAKWLSMRGEEVAIIEQSKSMYGGTCINVACIPTKSLITNAERGIPFVQARRRKDDLTDTLRKKNFDSIVDLPLATVIDGTASFVNKNRIKVSNDDKEQLITADRIFINTGTQPRQPDIPGVQDARVYDSTTLMNIDDKPKHLAIIGGGFIALEFADMFLKFGTSVTLFERNNTFLPNEDRDVADAIQHALVSRGLEIKTNASVERLSSTLDDVTVHYRQSGIKQITADMVLCATGRVPATAALNLEAAGIATDERGYIRVNEQLQTSADNIWAIGDVNGGPQFTYISLDDFRIIKNQLEGGNYVSRQQREAFATTVFISPPLAHIGISETEASKRGLRIKTFSLPAANIPKAAILNEKIGLLKAIVEVDTGKLLGCTLFCAEAHELINMAQLVINANMPYTVLRDMIYTHPTMAEGFNELFS